MPIKEIKVSPKMLKQMQRNSIRVDKSAKVKIQKIVKFTSNKKHAWVETNIGLIRKPISKIPTEIINAY